MAKKKKLSLEGHFIPNSHLDREWGMDFQQTRKMTVEFLDALIEIFEEIPEYKFLLDSQTVPLEDYLEIRPENRQVLIDYIRQGRLIIGPWYSAPDCHCINGESIVRNLLMGHRTARDYGPVMKVGYTPFGFGQVGQLPQIYAGFGIDTVLFYRGISADDTKSSEFEWEAPDGTRLLASRFGIGARYNFYMYVWRPSLYQGRKISDRLYDWSWGGTPFKFIDKEHQYDNYFLMDPKRFYDPSSVEKYFRELIEKERKHFSTPAIALMQGMDTSAPDPQEADLLREIQKILKEDESVRFSSLPEYINRLKTYLKGKKLKVIKGERRSPHEISYWATLAGDVISNRPKQKQLTEKAERLLQRWAEPFCLWNWLCGAEYPDRFLEVAWKYMLKSHAHDTIGGCGVDVIEPDALYRLRQVENLSTALLREALGSIQKKIDTSFASEKEVVLTVFNPSPVERSEVVRAFVDVPDSSGIAHLHLFDSGGKPVQMHEGRRRVTEKVIRSHVDVTNSLTCHEVEMEFMAEKVPALGYKSFVVRGGEHLPHRPGLALTPQSMENDYLKVSVSNCGSLTVFDKVSGKTYPGLHIFEDGGEAGEPWTRHPTAEDRIVTSAGSVVQISLDRNSPLCSTIHVRYRMEVPVGMSHDTDYYHTRRTETEAPLEIDSYFTLRKDSRFVEVETHLDNRHKNHRLRVLFPTRLEKATHSYAESAFDVPERVIDRDEKHFYRKGKNPDYPMLRFAGISDGQAGLAILSDGNRVYEAIDNATRTIAVTLIRAFEIALCTVSYRWERLPEMQGSQAQGRHCFRYAIYPHSGKWDGGKVQQEAERFALPLLPAQSAPSPGEGWPASGGLLEVLPEDIQLSGMKKSEEGEDVILRLYNPTGRKIKATVHPCFDIARCQVVTLEELPSREKYNLKKSAKRITLEIPGKKVVTIRMKPRM
jgi:mannosylglycerate hydrolase